MAQLELQKTGNGYSVATVGNLSAFGGKAFVKDAIGTTSMEASFGSLAAGEALPFFHHHKQNEELYIILSGNGVFSLDGNNEEVSSGSIVKVSPQVSRGIKNTGNDALVYICIQARENSLEQYTMTDGVIEG